MKLFTLELLFMQTFTLDKRFADNIKSLYSNYLRNVVKCIKNIVWIEFLESTF